MLGLRTEDTRRDVRCPLFAADWPRSYLEKITIVRGKCVVNVQSTYHYGLFFRTPRLYNGPFLSEYLAVNNMSINNVGSLPRRNPFSATSVSLFKFSLT